ncbi:GntR family transcriptional regulator [Dapis sp. BLCC M172]|uniref:GntR family transcriptional regulator n=1 Tax=Dapis sp. BLCC M172 TaxID=2975281 RepID=UPI003CF4B4FF
MFDFKIETDSDIPVSNQLFNQIRFAIASRQFPPGHQLPSTRQLAMQTGLHRNTISKVYRQLEETGLVESKAGSGIYVRGQENQVGSKSPTLEKNPNTTHRAKTIVKSCLNELLSQGCSLYNAREMFFKEISWRLSCRNILVTAPSNDIGIGELMAKELEEALGNSVKVQLVPLEELDETIDKVFFFTTTIVTSRYFIGQAEKIAAKKNQSVRESIPEPVQEAFLEPFRVIPVDIDDFSQEFELLKTLPKGSYCGLVSLSSGFLRAAEVIINGWRGNDVIVITAQHIETEKINSMVRSAKIIVCDRFCFDKVKDALQKNREDIIRPPEIRCIENYIRIDSINLLKRELGLI